nr:hypothetical protein [Tanacetum cinerariifolium]
ERRDVPAGIWATAHGRVLAFVSFKNHNFSLIASLSERQTKFHNSSDHGGNDPGDHTFQPQILFQTWETFFAIKCSQPEDSNELFQKLLKDLKELAEYDQSTSTDRLIFLNNEDHLVQNRESLENSSEENVVSKTNQEPPQDSNIHQLIDECCEEVPEEQKQKMEDTMFDLVKICHHKQFLCIHDDVDDLIESALDSKLLSINSI